MGEKGSSDGRGKALKKVSVLRSHPDNDTKETKFMMDYLKAEDKMISAAHMRGTRDYEFKSIAGLLLKHGRYWDPKKISIHMTLKQCYRNAYLFSSRKSLTYVEGCALSIIPVMHAWVVDDSGSVLEITLYRPGSVYIGIPINRDYILKTMINRGIFGSVINDFANHYPLLKKFNVDKIIDPSWKHLYKTEDESDEK